LDRLKREFIGACRSSHQQGREKQGDRRNVGDQDEAQKAEQKKQGLF